MATIRAVVPDDKLDAMAAFVALELFNATKLMQAVDTILKQLAQFVSLYFLISEEGLNTQLILINE